MDLSVRLAVEAQIRRATLRDLPALATWSGQVEEVFRPVVESSDRVLLVALANGRFPIAHVLVDLRGILSHLLVLGGFRDQGLGTALVKASEAILRDAGSSRSTLMVEKVNDGAIRLYERLGYSRIGEAEATWLEPMPDGAMQPVAHPSWVMEKLL